VPVPALGPFKPQNGGRWCSGCFTAWFAAHSATWHSATHGVDEPDISPRIVITQKTGGGYSPSDTGFTACHQHVTDQPRLAFQGQPVTVTSPASPQLINSKFTSQSNLKAVGASTTSCASKPSWCPRHTSSVEARRLAVCGAAARWLEL